MPAPASAGSGASFSETPPAASGGGAVVAAYAERFVGRVPDMMGGRTPETGFSCDTFVYDGAGGIIAPPKPGTTVSHGTQCRCTQ